MLSPKEFSIAVNDHSERERISIEMNVRTQWECTRQMIFSITSQNPHIKKRPKKAQDVMRFAWEQESNKEQTVDQMRDVLIAIHTANVKKRVEKAKKIKNKQEK
jgi:hypothetical protein